ncbi:carbohydrate ABC transporter membrane protein 1 (CUT1 family) [Stella humosa]|uniref:Carbohydrate ABC transporter membrane protein 1 (CUT1 family) n=1 Tax=Stella humosa TaxID=94 RepID=A0A3N1MEI8_9PROT|nr:sugar ABC transporter permease [Stella humosa]ROP99585.1 carbohydrate ABC transporter membrane protein 1 (CUT1 family) [Stella humosa]BBK31190.1 ABC transporter permease [Stella humosa]
MVTLSAEPAAIPRRRPRLGRQARTRLLLILLMLPAILCTAVLVAWPIGKLIQISFYELRLAELMRPIVKPWTLANYEAATGHPGFLPSLMATAIFVFVGTALALVIGLATALLLDLKLTGSSLVEILVVSPWSVAPAIASLIWMFLLNDQFGLVNYLLLASGLVSSPVAFLTSPDVAIWAVTFATAWKAYPFFTIMMLAGLQSIPHSQYEAAMMDGAGRARRFLAITLPGLRGFLRVTVFLGLLSAFRNVESVLVMTGGGPARSTETLAVRVYTETFQFLSPGRGAALGVLTLIVAVATTLAFLYATRKRADI